MALSEVERLQKLAASHMLGRRKAVLRTTEAAVVKANKRHAALKRKVEKTSRIVKMCEVVAQDIAAMSPVCAITYLCHEDPFYSYIPDNLDLSHLAACCEFIKWAEELPVQGKVARGMRRIPLEHGSEVAGVYFFDNVSDAMLFRGKFGGGQPIT